MRKEFKVGKKEAGCRLDIGLCQLIPDLSRRKIRSIIDIGGVYLNKKRVRISSRQLSTGDNLVVEYDLSILKSAKRQNFSFSDSDILYEDEYCVIINKPPGLPSQATRVQSISHVIPVLKDYYKKKKVEKIPKLTLVHRLDKETSGALLVAKLPKYADLFGEIFKKRSIKKVYHALSYGQPKESSFAVDNFLSPISKNTGVVKPCAKHYGRDAFTKFNLIKSFKKPFLTSLIECLPKTGRSHQIRSHLRTSGLAIVGDKKYSTEPKKNINDADLEKHILSHHYLHARSLVFKHPVLNTIINIEASYPKTFEWMLSRFKG